MHAGRPFLASKAGSILAPDHDCCCDPNGGIFLAAVEHAAENFCGTTELVEKVLSLFEAFLCEVVECGSVGFWRLVSLVLLSIPLLSAQSEWFIRWTVLLRINGTLVCN